jgi:hypothetical protein
MPATFADAPRRSSFTADAMNDLLDFVVRDPRFPEIGLRGAIGVVLRRHLGVPPSEELVSLMARAFWDTWDDRLCELAETADDD